MRPHDTEGGRGSRGGSRIWQWGGGGKICSESSYIYERIEYKSAGGPGGAVSPREIFEFRTPESESEILENEVL